MSHRLTIFDVIGLSCEELAAELKKWVEFHNVCAEQLSADDPWLQTVQANARLCHTTLHAKLAAEAERQPATRSAFHFKYCLDEVPARLLYEPSEKSHAEPKQ